MSVVDVDAEELEHNTNFSKDCLSGCFNTQNMVDIHDVVCSCSSSIDEWEAQYLGQVGTAGLQDVLTFFVTNDLFTLSLD
jgi:hypothetical protein